MIHAKFGVFTVLVLSISILILTIGFGNDKTLKINGVTVESNKKVKSVENGRVTYEDGSWYDVSTGTVVNKGNGYININTTTQGESQELISTGPVRYSSQILDIDDVYANVEIYVVEGNEMVVEIEGRKPYVHAIEVKKIDHTLVIKSKPDASNFPGISVFTSVSSGTILSTSYGSTASIFSGVPANETKVKVGVPKGSGVKVRVLEGEISIGDTEGSLHATNLSKKEIQVGKVTDATLIVFDSGGIHVKSVNGYLIMENLGYGDIRVKDGSVSQLAALVLSSGNIFFGGKAVSADLSILGRAVSANLSPMPKGNIEITYVETKPKTKIVGLGKINVKNW